jgi:hypothetical protein
VAFPAPQHHAARSLNEKEARLVFHFLFFGRPRFFDDLLLREADPTFPSLTFLWLPPFPFPEIPLPEASADPMDNDELKFISFELFVLCTNFLCTHLSIF